MEISTLVIKVKYGDMLRRFSVQIVDEDLHLNIDELKEKIFYLFKFPPNTKLMLTYIDEDGDVVTLVDDDDLCDVVRQALNPLRITVKVNAEENGRPFRLPTVQQPSEKLNILGFLKTVPEPLHESLLKFSNDWASKTSSSAPGIAELVDCFSKMCLSYIGQLSDSQPGVQSSQPNDLPRSTMASKETTDLDSSNSEERPLRSNEDLPKLKAVAISEYSDVKLGNVTAGSMEPSSKVPGYKAKDAASGSLNVGGYPDNDSLHGSTMVDPKPSVVASSIGKKKKMEKISEFNSSEEPGSASSSPLANNIPTEKVLNKPSEPQLGPKPANVGSSPSYADPMKWGHTDSRTRYVLQSGSGKSPVSYYSPSPVNMHPIFGIPAGNDSAVPPLSPFHTAPFMSYGQNDSTGSIIHLGVSCDGCGALPITGPRFKSKVKMNYDLCSICFAEMGNDTDYIKLGHPVAHDPMSFVRLNNLHAKDPVIFRDCKAKPSVAKLDSQFIKDMNIIDGTVMAASTPFTKIWRMRNSGTSVWPQKTKLIFTGGNRLSNVFSVELEIPAAGLPVEQEIDVAVNCVAPELPGQYISYWSMVSPSGMRFGQRVWVRIQVDASKALPALRASLLRGLNLNLPPVNISIGDPEIRNMDLETMVHDKQHVPANSNGSVEFVEALTEVQPNEQEVKFPINDMLLVGGAASSSVCPVPSSSLSYPMVDPSEVEPALPSPSPALLSVALPNMQASVQEVSEKHEVEEKRLKDLDEMGFKHVNLNKEILRMNEYNLERSVDDLCAITWDSIH